MPVIVTDIRRPVIIRKLLDSVFNIRTSGTHRPVGNSNILYFNYFPTRWHCACMADVNALVDGAPTLLHINTSRRDLVAEFIGFQKLMYRYQAKLLKVRMDHYCKTELNILETCYF
jgi:hypothetical protein